MLEGFEELRSKLGLPKPSNPIEFLAELDKSLRNLDSFLREVDRRLKTVDFVRFTEVSEKRGEEREKDSEADTEEKGFYYYLLRGLRDLQLAESKVPCPTVRRPIEEINVFAEEKLEELKEMLGDRFKATEEVLEEEGVEDWTKLDEERKREIKEKIRKRLKEVNKYG